jgi:hypothetical protein
VLLMLAGVLVGIPLQNGAFSEGLTGWTIHRHGSSGQPPVVRVETGQPALLIDSRDAAAGGVTQTVYSTPGTLLRLTVRTRSDAAGRSM